LSPHQVQAIQQDPHSVEFLKERYVGEPYNLETLLKLPKGSLGWTYATVLNTLGYDPEFYRTPSEFKSDAEYISYRVYRTHDIHHVITGFSVNNLGELGVVAVTAAQTRFPAFIFLDIFSLLVTFFRSDRLHQEDSSPAEQSRTLKYVFEQISAGLEIGQNAQTLFPVKWEELFDRQIEELREELNIIPVREGLYSWYSDPKLIAAIA
jgi:ubiquinone biosynthesis protein Coq4